MCSPVQVPTSTDAFAEKLLAALNGSAMMMMISIGHRTGLFDAMAGAGALTASELAQRAGLNERYVREWLSAMTVSAVVRHHAHSKTFELPDEHAALLTRAARPNNLAVAAQFVAVLGAVEDDVVECFHVGGGVPYSRYARFHEVMAEESDQTVIAGLFEHVLPLVEGLQQRLEAGIDVLDLGCGRGRALLALAQRFPASRFVGYDLSEEAIGFARDMAAAAGVRNLRFEIRDLSDFGQTADPAAFDFVTTFDAVHDQARPQSLLDGIRRTLRADGVYLMQDIAGSSHLEHNHDHPLGTFMYTISCMHCMTVSLAQGGEGLGTLWGEELAQQMLARAGFGSVGIHRLAHDIQNAWYVVRPH